MMVGIALGCVVTALRAGGAISPGKDDDGGSDASPVADRQALRDGDGDGNPYQETVPCTGPHGPVNFEVFSAGPTPAGLPLTGTSRRCDTGVPRWGWPNNYVNYSHGAGNVTRLTKFKAGAL